MGFDLTVPLWSSRTTLGLFVPLIDVGNLISISRLADGSAMMNTRVAANPDPLQFVSPGVMPYISLGNTPLIFGVAATVAPFGRIVVQDSPTMGEQMETPHASVPSIRLQAVLAMDLTIYSF